MSRQRGMAVVMALLLVALAAAATSMVLWQQQLWWRQLEADRDSAAMAAWLDAELDWAMVQLRRPEAERLRPLAARDGPFVLAAVLEDMQGRFNLNSLAAAGGSVDPVQLAGYRRLLAALRLPAALADNLVSWRGLRAADARPAPGSVARPLARWALLARVPGYGPPVLARLEPYVAVLPDGVNQVNVNSAAPQLLEALLPQAAPAAIAALCDARRRRALRDTGALRQQLNLAADADLSRLTVGSTLYRLRGSVSRPPLRRGIEALLRIDPDRVRLLWRTEQAQPSQPSLTENRRES